MPRPLDEIAASVFLGIAVVVVVARLAGLLVRRVRQPVVVAEIFAGLALGPSLLGLFPGNPTLRVFPMDVRPFLTVIAGLGLIIFMFIVGLELDLALIRGKTGIAAKVSLTSIALPFTLGCVLALWLYPSHSFAAGHAVERLPFALFIGAAMSVTAFPVLARILTERGMHRTETGALALACAAIDDVLAWTMLAVVLAVVQASGPAQLVEMLIEATVFVVVMFRIVRPRLQSLVDRRRVAGGLTPNIFAVVLVGILVSAYVTNWIGIHAIFGAFVFGAIMPREDAAPLSQDILERLEQVTVLLLLPVFFIATGLNVNIRGLGPRGWVELAAVLVVACVGKFVGAAGAARLSGISARRSSAVGILMNTRGLTELVILNIGFALGILDRQLFTVLVLMAVITTVITDPLLRLVYPDRMVARDVAQAERAALGLTAAYRVVAVANGPDSEAIVDVGVGLLGDESSSQLLISRFDVPVRAVEVGAGLTSELAAIANSFEALQSLSDRATHQGATVVVDSQFSDDLVADILTQASSVDADVVVLGADDPGFLSRIFAEAECAVVLVPPQEAAGSVGQPPETPTRVVVIAGTDDDGLAAVEQAYRIASRGGVDLVLAQGRERREQRRIAALQRRLAVGGRAVRSITLADLDLDAPGSLLVCGWSDWLERRPLGAARVLVVKGAPDDHGERLGKLLADVASRAAPQGAEHS
jgi:Kef-type K+ transport system membrane component KefB